MDIYKIMEKYSGTTEDEEDDSPSRRIKQIIFNELNDVDRYIILLYAELGSLRKLATLIGVSPTACHFRVKEIKNKIKDKLKNDTQPDND